MAHIATTYMGAGVSGSNIFSDTCKHRRISRLLSIHANTYKMIALSFARQ
jgi:hypothetical protein